MRPSFLYFLGCGQLHRYELSHQNEDLDQCILQLTQAILLPHRPWAGPKINIAVMFFWLAKALLRRSEKSKQPDGVNSAIDYFHWLQDHSLEACDISRNEMMVSLVEAFSIRTRLGSGDRTQDIEDMIALCDEPKQHGPAHLTKRALFFLILAVTGDSSNGILNPPSDKSIESLRGAGMRWPSCLEFSFALATSLTYRFIETFSDDDYNEAVAILNRVIVSSSREDSAESESWSDMSSALLTTAACLRSSVYGNPEYAEEAMSHLHSLSRSSSGDRLRFYAVRTMELLEGQRLRLFGIGKSPAHQEPVFRTPKVVDSSPSPYLDPPRGEVPESGVVMNVRSPETLRARIHLLNERLSTTSPGTPLYLDILDQLVDLYQTKVSLTGNATDIKEAIKYCRLLLHSTHSGGLSSTSASISLARLLGRAFERTHRIWDINESIGLLRGVIKSPMGQILCDAVFPALISSLLKRHTSSHGNQYIPDMIETFDEYFPLAADSRYSPLPKRLEHSCIWAKFSRGAGRPSVSTAYEKAMSLMEDLVIFAPNLQSQHTTLVAKLGKAGQLPVDYASHLIHINQLERAIETLERGRALLWSELRGFRTSVDQLSAVDPFLAQTFTAINRDLERLTMSVLPSGKTELGGTGSGGSEGADPFNRLLLKQRKLLEGRNRLISHIKTLPGFHNFLSAPSFDNLRSAASCGPVILINHSEYRSDILILHHSSPSLISTSEGFYSRASGLKGRLLNARKKSRLDPEEYESTLASVLTDLYELVGQPVIDRLHELNIPEQSRVWWCPTSVFCSLPLHAMGPIPSDDGVKRYFSDLYIPSYTSTLSALIESRKPGTQLSRRPSLLLVAQPDESLPGVRGEIKVIQELDIKVERLARRNATSAAVIEGLKRHEFVHFACHGILEIGKPFDASFKLHGDDRLTLLDIVHSRLPTAEFAFLSACHTAELTEESIDDEGLHLAAALQYCGFQSVVGTMWAMADTDGRDVSRWFYQSMLSEAGEEEVPYHERSARALRDAVRELRDTKHVPLERWVNFVHYGA